MQQLGDRSLPLQRTRVSIVAAAASACAVCLSVTACVAPKSAGRALRSAGRRGKRMIFAQMAGLLAMPTLLPEGVLSAEGEDAQAVKGSWETASSPPTHTHRATLNPSLVVRPRYDQDRSFQPMGWVTCPFWPENSLVT